MEREIAKPPPQHYPLVLGIHSLVCIATAVLSYIIWYSFPIFQDSVARFFDCDHSCKLYEVFPTAAAVMFLKMTTPLRFFFTFALSKQFIKSCMSKTK